jgi:hypothetical protein
MAVPPGPQWDLSCDKDICSGRRDHGFMALPTDYYNVVYKNNLAAWSNNENGVAL